MAAHCLNVADVAQLSPSNSHDFQVLFRLHCGRDGLFAFSLLYRWFHVNFQMRSLPEFFLP